MFMMASMITIDSIYFFKNKEETLICLFYSTPSPC